MKPRILVTARGFREVRGEHWEILERAGCEVIESPVTRPLIIDELLPLIAPCHGVILGLDRVTANVFAAAPHLRVISRYGVGVDNVDVAAATAAGVVVTITPGANQVAVAELTLALALALARSIPQHDKEVRRHGSARWLGMELCGKTLGLIGLGRIGREVALRAVALGMRVVYFDPVRPPEEEERSLGVTFLPFDEALAVADLVSVHAPLTPQTRRLIGKTEFGLMKPGALLINTARGELIAEDALREALRQGSLSGAALDVRAGDLPADDPLLECGNVIFTPHIGSHTKEAALAMGRMASSDLVAVLRGERPASVVNPEVYESGRDAAGGGYPNHHTGRMSWKRSSGPSLVGE
jgi:D-3-phosphoglycerate dehydrogenase / 2-oxoglutarate reductase